MGKKTGLKQQRKQTTGFLKGIGCLLALCLAILFVIVFVPNYSNAASDNLDDMLSEATALVESWVLIDGESIDETEMLDGYFDSENSVYKQTFRVSKTSKHGLLKYTYIITTRSYYRSETGTYADVKVEEISYEKAVPDIAQIGRLYGASEYGGDVSIELLNADIESGIVTANIHSNNLTVKAELHVGSPEYTVNINDQNVVGGYSYDYNETLYVNFGKHDGQDIILYISYWDNGRLQELEEPKRLLYVGPYDAEYAYHSSLGYVELYKDYSSPARNDSMTVNVNCYKQGTFEYLDSYQFPVYSDMEISAPTIDGYYCDNVQYVRFSSGGTANLDFYYDSMEATVLVYCFDKYGECFSSYREIINESQFIWPRSYDGYTLTSYEQYVELVPPNQCSPQEIYFLYEKNNPSPDTPGSGNATEIYVVQSEISDDAWELYHYTAVVQTGWNTIYAESFPAPPGYELASENWQDVYIDENGNASPEYVRFRYRPVSAENTETGFPGSASGYFENGIDSAEFVDAVDSILYGYETNTIENLVSAHWSTIATLNYWRNEFLSGKYDLVYFMNEIIAYMYEGSSSFNNVEVEPVEVLTLREDYIVHVMARSILALWPDYYFAGRTVSGGYSDFAEWFDSMIGTERDMILSNQ